ncbi:MAG: glycerol-3-phosphate dehydrogenase subunit GlpB [Deltaproteobacteria bacterium]|nr:glycerol-3-phosphate dehydrogenase subunit GlpB [Deltaproteobacteria bacterium]
MHNPDIECELMIIGLGISGMASALFAANRGISTVQTGMTGEVIFASSLIDLMGVHPVQNKKTWADPWAAIRAVSKDIPDHPYARIQKNHIQKALDEFASFFGDAGFKYYRHKNLNSRLITSAGTIKQTYLVPQSMWNGVSALEEKAPCLIVDFHGLKGFSARQIVSVLKNKWPGLQHLRISLPGTGGKRDEVYSENIARSLELPSNREKLAENIRPYLKSIKVVGMPPVLGMQRTGQALRHMKELIGVPVFEIPTMPPSITGLRLRETFEEHFHGDGIRTLYQKKVLGSRILADGSFIFDVGTREKETTVKTKGAILASGRFIGKGLSADRKHIHETIFDLQKRPWNQQSRP